MAISGQKKAPNDGSGEASEPNRTSGANTAELANAQKKIEAVQSNQPNQSDTKGGVVKRAVKEAKGNPVEAFLPDSIAKYNRDYVYSHPDVSAFSKSTNTVDPRVQLNQNIQANEFRGSSSPYAKLAKMNARDREKEMLKRNAMIPPLSPQQRDRLRTIRGIESAKAGAGRLSSLAGLKGGREASEARQRGRVSGDAAERTRIRGRLKAAMSTSIQGGHDELSGFDYFLLFLIFVISASMDILDLIIDVTGVGAVFAPFLSMITAVVLTILWWMVGGEHLSGNLKKTAGSSLAEAIPFVNIFPIRTASFILSVYFMTGHGNNKIGDAVKKTLS